MNDNRRMKFNPSQENLPIIEVFDEVRANFAANHNLVLTAPPGAGKSTLLPLALLNEPWMAGKKILMLEPRRLAARGIASRMAELTKTTLGDLIGYRVRFDTKVSAQTRIEILTEGILTRILQNDNALENVALVIFDEFHERSIHADIAFAFTRETQAILNPDLRILIMSATINTKKLTDLLDCPLVESQGKQYPVSVIYENEADEHLIAESCAAIVTKALKDHKGDVLVFLPGEREIGKCAEILRSKTDFKTVVVHELYGRLPQNQQNLAISPNKQGKRKIVLATSIAETSLTIEGVTIVVDAGFSRVAVFDPRSGLSGLKTIRLTKDAADQRAGRSGRLAPGICYRLWSKASHAKLGEQRIPEILEADLAPLMLNLCSWGISNVTQLAWVDEPPKHAVEKAKKTLEVLDALVDGRITPHGKAMNELPTHPRIAHLLLTAKKENILALATDLAAIIEERDPLPKEAGIDITLRIEALRRYRKNKGTGGRFTQIERVASQYRQLVKCEEENGSFDPYEVGLLLVHAYPERIAFARPGNNAQFQLSNGAYAMAGHKDDLAQEPWLAIANLNDQENGIGRIFLAAPLNPTDLKPFLREHVVTEWNTKKGGVIANKEMRIGSIVLKSTPIDQPNPEMIEQALIKAIEKEGKTLLNFDQKVIQWQNRVAKMTAWKVEGNWPDVSIDHLLATCRDWLATYLVGIRKTEDLKKIDLLNVLNSSLAYEQQVILDELAPATIKVPSGSAIHLEYETNRTEPILPVRIQEVFGMLKTPTVNGGKINVLMHLLSPGFKLVQTTNDLESFWKNVYFEIRKELRIKYKKHEWPENPLVHPPTTGPKKRIQQ